MTALPFIGFALIALAAIGFATFAVWRGAGKGRVLLAVAIALFLLGVGGGTYWMLGEPSLALREAQGLNTRDVRALIPFLIKRVRQAPTDGQGWAYLGRAYISSGDAEDAAKAYGHAVALARQAHASTATLESTYGQLLVAANNGAIGPDAEAAFAQALHLDPKDGAARFYLGQAHADRGDKQGALDLWQGLLAEVPENAPLHQMLVDRIALLTAQTLTPGGGAPDPRQMVAGLAARLKDNPDDSQGWQRLIRAYTVLGEPDKAKEALATARKTFAGHQDVLAELATEAVALKLE